MDHYPPPPNNPAFLAPQRESFWQKSKVLIKAGLIFFLTLLLLIPVYMVRSLVEERAARQEEAIGEVSSKWAGPQTLTGPILVVPYELAYTAAQAGANANTTATPSAAVRYTRQYAYFLPEELKVASTLNPIEKHRGIYKVMLYESVIDLSGSFVPPNLDALGIDPARVLWSEAFLRIALSDNKGLNEELKVNWGDTALSFVPDATGDAYGGAALRAPLKLTGAPTGNVAFVGRLKLKGSSKLRFTPVGRSSVISMKSSYPDPSFEGNALPEPSQVSPSGFDATWRSLAHNRSYPQQFTDAQASGNTGQFSLESAAVGTDLFVPVNAYQKTERSLKYALLCIALTFVAFFLIDAVNKKGVHPFQYLLIGLALVIFYALLLSFSEYIGFNAAYAIAAVATIGLIAWFVRGLLASGKLTTILSGVLVLLYTYIFSILQLQDYALLFGSLGLFLTLGIVMYFSKKLSW